jgi:hypothetical protein
LQLKGAYDAIQEVKAMLELVGENDEESKLLLGRINALDPALKGIQSGMFTNHNLLWRGNNHTKSAHMSSE